MINYIYHQNKKKSYAGGATGYTPSGATGYTPSGFYTPSQSGGYTPSPSASAEWQMNQNQNQWRDTNQYASVPLWQTRTQEYMQAYNAGQNYTHSQSPMVTQHMITQQHIHEHLHNASQLLGVPVGMRTAPMQVAGQATLTTLQAPSAPLMMPPLPSQIRRPPPRPQTPARRQPSPTPSLNTPGKMSEAVRSGLETSYGATIADDSYTDFLGVLGPQTPHATLQATEQATEQKTEQATEQATEQKTSSSTSTAAVKVIAAGGSADSSDSASIHVKTVSSVSSPEPVVKAESISSGEEDAAESISD